MPTINARYTIISLLLVSCFDEKIELEKMKKSNQSLVFNSPNVNTQLEQVVESHTLASGKQNMYMITALSSTANARVEVKEKYIFNESLRQCDLVTEPQSSNGTMTSDSRMITTWHTISGAKDRNTQNFAIYFDYSLESISHPNANFLGSDGDYYMGNGVYSDSPWLANRLWSLGLKEAAEYKELVSQQCTVSLTQNRSRRGILFRQFFRQWNFTLDNENKVQDLVTKDPDFPLSTTNFKGRDIAVLKAEGPSDGDVSFLPAGGNYILRSGPFPLTKPAIFFNQVPVFSDMPPNNTSSLFALHTTTSIKDYDSSTNTYANRSSHLHISNPGYASSKKQIICDIYDDCNQAVPSTYKMTDCLQTTLDARPGSSGGMIFSNSISTDEAGNKSYSKKDLVGTGILQGTEVKDENISKVRDWDFRLNVSPESGRSSLDEFTQVTLIGSNESSWAKRDIDYFPGAKNPDRPQLHVPQIADNNPGNCELSDSLGVCYTRAGDEIIANSAYGAPPSNIPDSTKIRREFWTKAPNSYGNPSIETETNRPHPNPPGTDGSSADIVAYLCGGRASLLGNIKDAPHDAELAYGILGSASQSPFVRVASLLTICGPHSFYPWSDNWSALRILGRLGKGTTNTLLRRNSFLKEALTYTYELRDGMHRPLSFQMCPPNYYMSGLRFRTKDVDGKKILVGIVNLKCSISEKGKQNVFSMTNGRKWETVNITYNCQDHTFSPLRDLYMPLDAGAGNDIDGEPNSDPTTGIMDAKRLGQYEGFTFGGQPFSLSQMIGNPKSLADDATTDSTDTEHQTSCPQGKAVKGIAVDAFSADVRNVFEPITKFWLVCGKAPD